MKKILSILVMLFCAGIMFSHNTSLNNIKAVTIMKDNRNFNFKPMEDKLSDYLRLTPKEKKDLFDIHESFNEKMCKASLITDKDKKSDEIYKAINFELNGMKAVLDSVQYNKFVKIFNVTLNNRGFFENITLKNIEKNV